MRHDVSYIERTKEDRIGKRRWAYAETDHTIHAAPHSWAVYDAANDEFLGEFRWDGGGTVLKTVIDGETGWVGGWTQDFDQAIQNVALAACGNLDRKHKAYEGVR